jgi:hypothetical protein
MKLVSRLLSLLVLTAAFVVLTGTACDQKSTPDRAWERGAFQPVDANIKSYSLPAGIAIDNCYGYDDYVPKSNLPLFMVVSNSTTTDVTVTFPAGLVFDPSNAEYQYMMLLQDFTFTAKVGVTDSILVPTYCCNEELGEPDDESFYLTISGQEWDKETEELFNLVANKKLDTDDALDVAVDALFEITDGAGLTDSTRTALNALP